MSPLFFTHLTLHSHTFVYFMIGNISRSSQFEINHVFHQVWEKSRHVQNMSHSNQQKNPNILCACVADLKSYKIRMPTVV